MRTHLHGLGGASIRGPLCSCLRRRLVRVRNVIGAKPISKPGLRHEEVWSTRVRLKLVAQRLDTDTQTPGIVLAIRTPDFAQKLALSHNHTGLARKALEDAVLQRRQVDASLRSVSDSAREVNLHGPEFQH